MPGWRHVQTDDVFEFLDEPGVTRDLEATYQVRLHAVGAPVARDAGRTDAQFGGHLAGTPVRRCFGCALRGQFHQSRHIHLHRRGAARQVALDSRQPRLRITPSPTRHLYAANPQLIRDLIVSHPISGQQHNPRTLCQPHAGAPGTRKLGQLATLLFGQDNLRGNSHLHLHSAHNVHWRRGIQTSSLKNATLH
jgi:hypothetical protein